MFATINLSQLWEHCKVLKLTKNMRLQCSPSIIDKEDKREFAEWILKIGDGELGEDIDGKSNVEIP